MVSGVHPNNDAGFDARMTFVKTLLFEKFKLEVTRVDTLDYHKNCPVSYNNYAYLARINPDSVPTKRRQRFPQHGAAAIPADTASLVLRLSASDRGYNEHVRVENEVAAIALAREALGSRFAVPKIFGWENARDGKQGWILMEHIPGKDLSSDFPNMEREDKRIILDQLADALCLLQRYKLPASVSSFGGLAFSETGEVVSTAMSKLPEGPFDSIKDLYLASVRHALFYADENPRIRGWHANGVRARIDHFVADGLPHLIPDLSDLGRVLVHGDFGPSNALYDPATMRITAIFDFDFAYIGTVADEFRSGFAGLPNLSSDEQNNELRKALLEGFPDPLPRTNPRNAWNVPKMFDDLLAEKGAKKPSNIPGMAELSTMGVFKGLVLPHELDRQYRLPGERARVKARKIHEERLSEFLTEHGY